VSVNINVTVIPLSRASSLPQGISVVPALRVFKSIQRIEIKTKPLPAAITAPAPATLLACIDFNTDEISRTSQNNFKPLNYNN
jgi:hypothetical protein